MPVIPALGSQRWRNPASLDELKTFSFSKMSKKMDSNGGRHLKLSSTHVGAGVHAHVHVHTYITKEEKGGEKGAREKIS